MYSASIKSYFSLSPILCHEKDQHPLGACGFEDCLAGNSCGSFGRILFFVYLSVFQLILAGILYRLDIMNGNSFIGSAPCI